MKNKGIKKPLTLSVITAAYNALVPLPMLVESLRKQSDQDFEWVVADGASDDGTLEYLQSIDDLNIVLCSQPDFGIYDALNRAIRMASGDYYIVVGADDSFNPDAIANFRAAIDRSNADIVAADVKCRGRQVSVRKGPPWLFGHSAFIAAHSLGTAFRKGLHSQHGFFSKKFPIAADQLFVMQACQCNASRYVCDFVAGEVGDEGVSSSDSIGSATEVFRVQVLLGRSVIMQALLLLLRLLKKPCRILE